MYRCSHCHKLWSEHQVQYKLYPLLGESVKLCPVCGKEVEPIRAESKEVGLKTGRRAATINAVHF